MISEMTDMQKKLIAIALLLLLVLGVQFMMVEPYFEEREQLQSKQIRLTNHIDRFRSSISKKAAYQIKLQEISENKLLNKLFIESQSIDLASAELQKKVKIIVVKHRAKLTSTQVMHATNQQDGPLLTKVAVKVAMKGTMSSIYKVFYELENNLPLLFLSDVAIKSYGTRRYIQSNDGNTQLDVRFNLSAYLKENLS